MLPGVTMVHVTTFRFYDVYDYSKNDMRYSALYYKTGSVLMRLPNCELMYFCLSVGLSECKRIVTWGASVYILFYF